MSAAATDRVAIVAPGQTYVGKQGITYGAGVTLPVGPWGSLGYDFADVPLVSGLDRQQRHGWSVSLDPVRFWWPAP